MRVPLLCAVVVWASLAAAGETTPPETLAEFPGGRLGRSALEAEVAAHLARDPEAFGFPERFVRSVLVAAEADKHGVPPPTMEDADSLLGAAAHLAGGVDILEARLAEMGITPNDLFLELAENLWFVNTVRAAYALPPDEDVTEERIQRAYDLARRGADVTIHGFAFPARVITVAGRNYTREEVVRHAIRRGPERILATLFQGVVDAALLRAAVEKAGGRPGGWRESWDMVLADELSDGKMAEAYRDEADRFVLIRTTQAFVPFPEPSPPPLPPVELPPLTIEGFRETTAPDIPAVSLPGVVPLPELRPGRLPLTAESGTVSDPPAADMSPETEALDGLLRLCAALAENLEPPAETARRLSAVIPGARADFYGWVARDAAVAAVDPWAWDLDWWRDDDRRLTPLRTGPEGVDLFGLADGAISEPVLAVGGWTAYRREGTRLPQAPERLYPLLREWRRERLAGERLAEWRSGVDFFWMPATRQFERP